MTNQGLIQMLLASSVMAAFVSSILGFVRDRQLHRFEKELERFRTELSARRDLLASQFRSLSDIHAASHERVLESIEFIWRKVLATRDFTGPFLGLYQGPVGVPVKAPGMKVTAADFDTAVAHCWGGVRERRPFVGEPIWMLFGVHFLFATHLARKASETAHVPQVRVWDRTSDGAYDDFPHQVLKDAFTDEELSGIVTAVPSSVPQRVLTILEAKILDAMNEVLFGRRLVEMGLPQYLRTMGQADLMIPPV